MAGVLAVSNTSPIIALASIGQLSLLEALFEQVTIPLAVWAELIDKPGSTEGELVRALKNVVFYPSPEIPIEAATLDAGERDAIAHAVSMPGSWVLLDELAARRVAERLALPVRGTLGILLEAKRRGLIEAIKPLADGLIATIFDSLRDSWMQCFVTPGSDCQRARTCTNRLGAGVF